MIACRGRPFLHVIMVLIMADVAAQAHTVVMTSPYSVPIDDLDAVHVAGEELVEQQLPDLRWGAGALIVGPFGGVGGDVDGD